MQPSAKNANTVEPGLYGSGVSACPHHKLVLGYWLDLELIRPWPTLAAKAAPPAPASFGNQGGLGFVVHGWITREVEGQVMAADYDELRTEVKESQDKSLEALKSANAPDALSVVRELDAPEDAEALGVPGGEIVAEELTVQVVPEAADEFTCHSCFLVRHRSQLVREQDGYGYCRECEG